MLPNLVDFLAGHLVTPDLCDRPFFMLLRAAAASFLFSTPIAYILLSLFSLTPPDGYLLLRDRFLFRNFKTASRHRLS